MSVASTCTRWRPEPSPRASMRSCEGAGGRGAATRPSSTTLVAQRPVGAGRRLPGDDGLGGLDPAFGHGRARSEPAARWPAAATIAALPNGPCWKATRPSPSPERPTASSPTSPPAPPLTSAVCTAPSGKSSRTATAGSPCASALGQAETAAACRVHDARRGRFGAGERPAPARARRRARGRCPRSRAACRCVVQQAHDRCCSSMSMLGGPIVAPSPPDTAESTMLAPVNSCAAGRFAVGQDVQEDARPRQRRARAGRLPVGDLGLAQPREGHARRVGVLGDRRAVEAFGADRQHVVERACRTGAWPRCARRLRCRAPARRRHRCRSGRSRSAARWPAWAGASRRPGRG